MSLRLPRLVAACFDPVLYHDVQEVPCSRQDRLDGLRLGIMWASVHSGSLSYCDKCLLRLVLSWLTAPVCHLGYLIWCDIRLFSGLIDGSHLGCCARRGLPRCALRGELAAVGSFCSRDQLCSDLVVRGYDEAGHVALPR